MPLPLLHGVATGKNRLSRGERARVVIYLHSTRIRFDCTEPLWSSAVSQGESLQKWFSSMKTEKFANPEWYRYRVWDSKEKRPKAVQGEDTLPRSHLPGGVGEKDRMCSFNCSSHAFPNELVLPSIRNPEGGKRSAPC